MVLVRDQKLGCCNAPAAAAVVEVVQHQEEEEGETVQDDEGDKKTRKTQKNQPAMRERLAVVPELRFGLLQPPQPWLQGSVEFPIASSLPTLWSIASDFCGIHRFVPMVQLCECIHGRNRIPGCLRFSILSVPSRLPGCGRVKIWARERLLSIDSDHHSFSYAIEASNLGLPEDCIVCFSLSEGGAKGSDAMATFAFELRTLDLSSREKALGDLTFIGSALINGLSAAATSL